MEKTKTNRGFKKLVFKDNMGQNCSLQESSVYSSDGPLVWLGLEDTQLKILEKDAVEIGLINKTNPEGWMDYNIPEEVLVSTRMHLTQKQALEIAYKLMGFAINGELN